MLYQDDKEDDSTEDANFNNLDITLFLYYPYMTNKRWGLYHSSVKTISFFNTNFLFILLSNSFSTCLVLLTGVSADGDY